MEPWANGPENTGPLLTGVTGNTSGSEPEDVQVRILGGQLVLTNQISGVFMARKYYSVQSSDDDWALVSPSGARVKLYSASRHGSSEAAFAAATKEANKRNLEITRRR